MERLTALISKVIPASVGSLLGGGTALLASRWAAGKLDFDDPAGAFKDLQGLFGTASVAAIGFGLAVGVWLAMGQGTGPLTTAALTPVIVLCIVLIVVAVGPDHVSTGPLLTIYAAAGATSTVATSLWARRRSARI